MRKYFLISGNDEFAIKAKARTVITALAGEDFEDNPALEIIRGDSEDRKPEAILGDFLNSLRTPPFLSPEKIVWLRNFSAFDQENEKHAKILKEIVQLLTANTTAELSVVMDGPGVDQRKSFCKAFKALEDGEVAFLRKAEPGTRDFNQIQAERIHELAAEIGKRIEAPAIDYLIAAVGSDSGRLQTEMAKLACFSGEENNTITLEDCRMAVSRTPEALSWDFADALAGRDAAGALKVVNILMAQMRSERGASASLELAMVTTAARAFQDVLKTKCAADELNLPERIGPNYFSNLSESVKESAPGNMLLKIHPYRAFKLWERANCYTDRELTRIFAHLLAANRKLVSGEGDKRIVLEQMILAVTGVKR